MTNNCEDDEYLLVNAIYELSFRTKSNLCWDDLVNFDVGVQEHYAENILELLSDSPDLQSFAEELTHEVLELADNYNLAPWDGTMDEDLEEGETYFDYTVREYLLPFLKEWHQEVRKKTTDLWIKYARDEWQK